MQRPSLLPTKIHDESYAGVTYHLEGELVPVLTVELNQDQTIYFEHHVLLWKNPSVKIGLKAMKGALKRIFAGMQIFVTEASGTGQIALSRDGSGHIFPIHLESGQELEVREHQFLAATSNISYDFFSVSGVANLFTRSSGFFIDRFRAESGPGVLWLHGYGNVFEKVLAPGEQIDVEPGAWLYKDPQVQMDTAVLNLSAGLFSSSSFIVNRFTGPGRVGIQSMSVMIPEALGN